MNLICNESALPSPSVSTVKTLFLGGKSFLINTLKADKSYEISDQLIDFLLIICKSKL